jgi:DNA-binding transcriptional MerR regulator
MTTEELEAIATDILGSRWQTELARLLDVNARTVRFWASGARPIPQTLRGDLARLAEQRRVAVSDAIERLRI